MEKNKLEELRELLIIVDMVNGFVREGALHDEKIASTIEEQLKAIDDFLKKEEGIAFIKDCHEKDSTEFKRFPPHCLKGTSEAELVDELKPFEKSSLIYPKNSTSAIFAPHFLEDINSMKHLKKVVIEGCCTDICVMNLAIPLKNYFDQENREVEIVIPKDAVATFDSPVHSQEEYSDMAFPLLEQAGIKLVKTYERGKKNGK